jgi:hypothetical protein
MQRRAVFGMMTPMAKQLNDEQFNDEKADRRMNAALII